MKMGFVFYKGSKEEVEEKFAELKEEAKNGYPEFYAEPKEDTFEIDTAHIRISFLVRTTICADEYGIYQIFY